MNEEMDSMNKVGNKNEDNVRFDGQATGGASDHVGRKQDSELEAEIDLEGTADPSSGGLDCEGNSELEGLEDTLTEQLEVSKALAIENYERFMRVSAEFENFRKRSEKERVDLMRYGNEALFKDLLPVFDSFQKALPEKGQVVEIVKEDSTSSQDFVEGIHLILRQLSEVLKKNGLEEVDSAGQPFDPNLHQAIQRIESADTTEELIQDEFVKGYLLHERLIRPAMVSVLVPAPVSSKGES